MSIMKTELYPQAVRGGGEKSRAFSKARRDMWSELVSGISGLILAGFILGHLILESTMIFGRETYDLVAYYMEHPLPIAQIMVFVIGIIFFIHFVFASRKIPAKLYERKRMMELGLSIKKSKNRWNQPKSDLMLRRHIETSLWIWQVRTGMIVLALGAFHLFLVTWNVLTDMGYADAAGLSAKIASSRVESGLWILYLLLGISVVFHLSIGLYRIAIKWLADTWLNRRWAFVICNIILWAYIALNIAGVMALAGVISLENVVPLNDFIKGVSL